MENRYETICKLDGKKHSLSDCYFGDCSNDQYLECFPSEQMSSGVAKPIKPYTPRHTYPAENR